MADVASSCSSSSSPQQRKPSELTMEEYVTFIEQNKKLNTITDPDNQVETIASMIRSDDPDMQLEATSLFRNMLHINPPFKEVTEAGVVPRFVQFLDRHDLPQLQYEAVKILAMFAKTSERINVIVDNGAVPKLVNLLDVPYELIRAQVILTLGFIARESPAIRVRVLDNQTLETLLAQFYDKDNTENIFRNAAWTLLQFCKGIPPLDFHMSRQVVPVLDQLVHSSIEEVVANGLWALWCFSYGEFHANFKPGCRKLIDLLSHPSPSVILPVLHIVINIARDDRIITQYIVGDLKAACKLEKLLVGEYDNNIKKAALWVVVHITKRNCNHTQEVVSQGLINVLANLFTRSEDDDMKRVIGWAISKVTCNGTPQDVKSVSEACIQPLCDMLGVYRNHGQELALNCIRGLDRILDLWQQEYADGSDEVFRYVQMIEDAPLALQEILYLRILPQASFLASRSPF